MSEHELPFQIRPLPEGDFRVPELVGTFEGWRAWAVDLAIPRFSKPLLKSCIHPYTWKPRELSRAECNAKCAEDNIPGEQHGCGFYSAKTLEHLQTMSYSHYDKDTGIVCVVGQVANWGKVIEGTLGWRSEKSYPTQLYVPYEAARLAAPLSEMYGVPVRLENILKDSSKWKEGSE